jgi:glutamate-1-semialdehyde 2,1-aminomutase
MSLQGEKTRALYQQARKVMPHGVNSNFRYWGVDNTMVALRGEGAHIWDMDENRYIDYRLGFGPIILGHGYSQVVKAVQEAIQDGTIFAWTTPREVRLAEKIAKLTKVDKVRLTNTGTEATMHALRIARAYTGREKFIKFEGQYHGMSDYFLFSTASSYSGSLGIRRDPISVPVSSGIPKGIGNYVISLPFNDLNLLEKTVKAKWGEIAAIFVEPILGNVAGILPETGFLEGLRQVCDEYGIVLVLDEVKTGFRIALGGAQEFFNIKADLVTYAKAMGNGFPIAAIAGKEEVMMTIEPGGLAHGGTYTGNITGVAAAEATLSILENEPILETIFERGNRLMEGIDEILTAADIMHHMTGLPSIFGFILGVNESPKDFRDYCTGDDELYEKLAFELIRRGVMPDSDGREPWFLCYSHDDGVIDETLSIFEDSVKAVKK